MANVVIISIWLKANRRHVQKQLDKGGDNGHCKRSDATTAERNEP